MTVDFQIGPLYDEYGAYITTPAGTSIPRPFDIRHINRQPLGRSIGGLHPKTLYPGFDLVYEATGNELAKAIRARYSPIFPRVWIYILDHKEGIGKWFSATMLEPHVARGAGSTIASFVVPFRIVEEAP